MENIYDSKIDIKDVHKVQVEILLEVDKICKENNIKYQLFAGSLLGSIRHEGFIPWDDDIDICMLRKDYEEFLRICNTKLNSKYFLQNNDTDSNYIAQFSKIRKNGTLFLESGLSELDIHHGVFIDIFPLDNVMPNKLIGKIQRNLIYFIYVLDISRVKRLSFTHNNIYKKTIKSALYFISKLVPIKLTNNMLKKLFCMFNENMDAEYVTHMTNAATKNTYYKNLRKRDDFYNIIDGKFEGYVFPIPEKYDEVLKELFGEYMKFPPIEEQKPHHGIIEIKI